MRYTRVVFVTRLSAIGDVIIATRAIQLLLKNNYYPVFITSKFLKYIPEIIPSLDASIYIEKNVDADFYLKNNNVSQQDFFTFVNNIEVEKPPIFLDLQKTSRSKRARREIKKYIKISNYYTVSKRTLYRIFLIVLAFLCFSQRKKKQNLNLDKIQTISELQENIVKKIIEKDGRKIINTSTRGVTEGLRLDGSLAALEIARNDYICLCPGASGFIKTWPKENFRNLIDLILEKTKLNVVLCGAHSEEKIGWFLDYPPNERVVNLIHKTNLQQTLAVIANAKYVVTNDSFPAHAAAVFGVPATVLFGATSPKFGFVPRAENIKIEYLNLACSPCTRHGKSECRYKNLKCLTEITAENVFEGII